MTTHSEIYTKFLVEYDKLTTTSAYPSLTKAEVCTMLNKAYLALIAQKLTGNNPRAIQFESDNKAIEDIRPLITTEIIEKQGTGPDTIYANNAVVYNIPDALLYYLQSSIMLIYNVQENKVSETNRVEVKLVTHETAQKYMYTVHNKPWIESPVCYIEENNIIVLVDERHIVSGETDAVGKMYLTYIKKPNKFAEETVTKTDETDETPFELSDTVSEELINLAIIMSAETVESPRTTSKLNLRPLES